MKRTPRSARRRASRQFDANVPGFCTSGPYRSRTCFGSLEISPTSGTLVCKRYAISYCSMRDSISGSSSRSSWTRLSCPSVSRTARRLVAEMPSGLLR